MALVAAQNLIDLGRWQDALDALGPAITYDDTAAAAHCVAAHCLLALGQTKRAREAASSALHIDPGDPFAHYAMARVLHRDGRRGAALRAATEAVRLAPDRAPFLYILALCQLDVLEYDAARRTAAMALESCPHDPLAHLAMGTVALRELPPSGHETNPEAWDEAEQAYRNGLALHPYDEDLTVGLAELLCRRGSYLEATKIYLALVRDNERALEAISTMGVIFQQLHGDWQSMVPASSSFRRDITRIGVPSVEALMADFIGVVAESQDKVRDSLRRAVNLMTTVSRSLGGPAACRRPSRASAARRPSNAVPHGWSGRRRGDGTAWADLSLRTSSGRPSAPTPAAGRTAPGPSR
ncbi:tetratricopeptide repeat protein [Nonomuraea sp. CA-218870]|uniref:tetratricopeptide repeat protein n=1 Tax=Nonomuraea sp. CA-218870 TaxID=3239998 RepID=UPI003D8F0C8A